jgi:hypothetical protein
VSLAEIVEHLDQISQAWRSDTSAEQRLDLADLDDLLEQLDEVEQQTSVPPRGSMTSRHSWTRSRSASASSHP